MMTFLQQNKLPSSYNISPIIHQSCGDSDAKVIRFQDSNGIMSSTILGDPWIRNQKNLKGVAK